MKQRNLLLVLVSGSSILSMRQGCKTVVAAFVLIAFSVSATDFGLLLSASSKAPAGSGGCPLHSVKCCCPKVCKTLPKTKPSCHKSAEPDALSAARTTDGAACVVKAGCDKQEPSSSILPPLKDFVPESSEGIGFDPSRSLFLSSKGRFLPLDCSPDFFHPPRSFSQNLSS